MSSQQPPYILSEEKGEYLMPSEEKGALTLRQPIQWEEKSDREWTLVSRGKPTPQVFVVPRCFCRPFSLICCP